MKMKWNGILFAPSAPVVRKSIKVQFRFNVPKSFLPEEIKERLIAVAGNRINTEGELVISGRRYRT